MDDNTDSQKYESFTKIIRDLLDDLTNVFPEYQHSYQSISNSLTHAVAQHDLYEHCMKVVPPRFFDILYQNEDMFSDAEVDTKFLPDLDFKLFFTSDVSENSRKVLWKYLQLLLFTLVGDVRDKDAFGDAANLFTGINEGDLQDKMKEAFDNMGGIFEKMGEQMDQEQPQEQQEQQDSSTNNDNTSRGGFQMPNLGSIQDHLKTILEGKIGILAKELAEEMKGEFSDFIGGDVDSGNVNPKDIFKNFVKNPNKIKELIGRIKDKLEEKMKSGNISRDELMKEASDIMDKMKDFGGKDEMMNMMKNMAKTMGGGGKNARFNMGAFEAMAKQHEQKERLRKKLDERRKAKVVEENNKKKFVIEGEAAPEKTHFIHPDLLKMMDEEDAQNIQKKTANVSDTKKHNNKNNNKKKGKKKKN
jgi:hypothetical protein